MSRSSQVAHLLRSVTELPPTELPVRATGASASARALIGAELARHLEHPVVVLCPSAEEADALASDAATLAATILNREIPIHVLPTWDQSPYSSIAPSIRTRLERIAALWALREAPRGPGLWITTLAAACQRTLPPDLLAARAARLRPGERIESRETLLRRLQDAGYGLMDPVEDPGTLVARGEIIDVFPPGRRYPVRIELFGDEIERIREYDPQTQRAFGDPLGEVVIPPAREVLVERDTVAGLRSRLKADADERGIPRATRDPVLESVHEGMYASHADAWAPYAYGDSAATFWDHLPAGARALWCDELGCLQELDRFLEDQRERAAKTSDVTVIVPEPAILFPWSRALEHRIRERTALQLDRVELVHAEEIGAEEDAAAKTESEGHSEENFVRAKHLLKMRDHRDWTAGPKAGMEQSEPKFRLWVKRGWRVLVLASTQSQVDRIRYLLRERGFESRDGGPLEPGTIVTRVGEISEGFRWPAQGLVVLTEDDLLGSKHRKRPRKSQAGGGNAKDWSGLQALSDLQLNDLVVHVDHGIGRYLGLARLSLSGAPMDFLQLEYAGKDKLYLPVYRLNLIQKYVGAGDSTPLDKLGGQQFAKAKERVRGEVKKIAFDLVQLYAERKVRPGFRFSPRDGVFQEFEAKFPFEETPDQLKSIDSVLEDLESGRVMDRLVCGDVGYGKTEVAIRAAFRAVTDGKQVAVLVPTTVLAHQHEQSFAARMKDYPIRVESVSRFKPAKKQKEILDGVRSGKVDIVIGTHRLLSKDVAFNDLGLVIVDEEHRFGVEHKEKLKTLKLDTHVLTLTATPIPRTLHMALSGLRDISLMNTPPVDRLPIRTYVARFEDDLVKRAIEFELNRGGQVFFVHNRVQAIEELGKRIQELVPQAKVSIAHGQMGEGELEKAMLAFYRREANVLLCTSIIESGIDVPSANTLIVNRADAFGLAQLYQIRGRVGRSQQRGYAYLLVPQEGVISGDAKRRLEVIQRFVELGSGFSIASHDLEIRGGGDLLGPQQSGHIAALGFDLYLEILEEAVREVQGRAPTPEQERHEPEIKVPFAAFLSEAYVPDVHQRLNLYRRFSSARDAADLLSLEEELQDRFGPPPPEARNLVWMIRIKQTLKRYGIDALTAGPERVSLTPGKASRVDPTRIIALVSSRPKEFQLTPDSRLVASLTAKDLRELSLGIETLLARIEPRA